MDETRQQFYYCAAVNQRYDDAFGMSFGRRALDSKGKKDNEDVAESWMWEEPEPEPVEPVARNDFVPLPTPSTKNCFNPNGICGKGCATPSVPGPRNDPLVSGL